MEQKELLRKIAALTITTSIACITGLMEKNLLQSAAAVLGGFFSTFAGEYINQLRSENNRRALLRRHPRDLNHDLHQIIIKAIACTFRNIHILYNETLTDKKQKEEVQFLIEALIKEIEPSMKALMTEDKHLIQAIESRSESDVDELIQLLGIQLSVLPMIDSSNPFPEFVQKQFANNIQLCFAEELKDPSPDNHKAWVSYSRMVFSDLKEDLQKIVEQNSGINKKLDQLTQKPNKKLQLSAKKIEDLQKLIDSIESKPILFDEKLKEALSFFTDDLSRQIGQINITTHDTQHRIIEIGHQLTDTRKTLFQFEKLLSKHWAPHSAVLVGFIALLSIITLSIWRLYLNIQPFDSELILTPAKNLKLSTQYPAFQGGTITVMFGKKHEIKSVNDKGEILIRSIPSEYHDRFISLQLNAPYWKLQCDSLQLRNSSMHVFIIPDNSLAFIRGIVRTRDGSKLLSDVKVSVEGITFVSNSAGYFHGELPYHLQKEEYELSIYKLGYQSINIPYVPKSQPIEVRLLPLTKL